MPARLECPLTANPTLTLCFRCGLGTDAGQHDGVAAESLAVPAPEVERGLDAARVGVVPRGDRNGRGGLYVPPPGVRRQPGVAAGEKHERRAIGALDRGDGDVVGQPAVERRAAPPGPAAE